MTARYIGSVGTDDWGKAQIASLRGENLDLYIREVEGAASQIAVIVLEEGIGERTILWRRDARLQYPVADLRREMILGARILQNWSLEEVIRFAHAVAAMKCMHIGARRGIPTISEVGRFLREQPEGLQGLRR